MKTKKRWVFGCLLGVIGLLCTGAAVFWEGSLLPGKPCRPVSYPDAQTITETTLLSTPNDTSVVQLYYDSYLRVETGAQEETDGRWYKTVTASGEATYVCYSIVVIGN